MSVHVCHGEWFKHKILKADHLADLAITTAVWSKICLAAKRHNFIVICSSLSMAGSTVALITCKEDEGPSHGINSTPLSECRGLVPVLAVTGCWVFFVSKWWAWPGISNTQECGRGNSQTTSVFSDASYSCRRVYLDVIITWLEGLWLSPCCERPQDRIRTCWDMMDLGVQVPICSVFSFPKGSCPYRTIALYSLFTKRALILRYFILLGCKPQGFKSCHRSRWDTLEQKQQLLKNGWQKSWGFPLLSKKTFFQKNPTTSLFS